MKHKYQLIIEFESLKPVKKYSNAFIQYENGLAYFTQCCNSNGYVNHISEMYQIGTGKSKLKKLKRISK